MSRVDYVSLKCIRLLSFIAVISAIVLIFSSCGSAEDRKALTEKTDALMRSLADGNYSEIPAMTEAFKNLEPAVLDQLESAMDGISVWDIKVESVSDYKAAVKISADKNGSPVTLVFNYTRRDSDWELDNRVSFSQSVDFIPLIRKVDE